MEIDWTLFMTASGRDVDYQGRHRKVCTQNYPSEGAVRRDKGQKRPPVGNVRRLWPQEFGQAFASREATPAFCPCRPKFPRLTPPGQLVRAS